MAILALFLQEMQHEKDVRVSSCNHMHATRARRYVADLLIAFLQNYAAATVLFPVGPADSEEVARALPEPMLPGNWEPATGACLHDESLQAALVQVRAYGRRLLP